MNIVIATSRAWNEWMSDELFKQTEHRCHLFRNQNDLSIENLEKIKPDFIFFPHWSYIIPTEIYKRYECVIFHMTDLPYGRGGSPLQNLIVRGVKDTKISALKCSEVLDGGPIYLKKSLSLEGSAQQIFQNASTIIFQMILEILRTNPTPLEQKGEVVEFSRRKSSESDISTLDDISKIYDYIRMLDADGYPHAFLEHKNIRFEFTDASFQDNEIYARVKITGKKND